MNATDRGISLVGNWRAVLGGCGIACLPLRIHRGVALGSRLPVG